METKDLADGDDVAAKCATKAPNVDSQVNVVTTQGSKTKPILINEEQGLSAVTQSLTNAEYDMLDTFAILEHTSSRGLNQQEWLTRL